MQTDYDLLLVLASYGVAVVASYCALDLGGRIAFFDGARQWLWLAAGAVAMGTGVWSMHFIGMQALRLPTALTYDLPLTALSWAAAVSVSLLALYVISRDLLSPGRIAIGSVLMGLGICVMHHSGMYALRMTPAITYDPALFLTATVIAVAASAAALFICFNVRRLPEGRIAGARIAAALVMGGAISGMHYTGMASAQFAPGAVCAPGNALGGDWVGWPVAAFAVGLLAATLALSALDARALSMRRRIVHERAEAARSRASRAGQGFISDRAQFEALLQQRLAAGHCNRVSPFAVVHAQLRAETEIASKVGPVRSEEVLETLSATLVRLLPPGDCLARLTPTSFALLLGERPGRSLDAAIAEAAAVLDLAVVIRGKGHRFGWTLGCSRYPEQGATTAALLAAAMRPRQTIGAPLPRASSPASCITA